MPSDAFLDQALRDKVKDLRRSGNAQDLTVKRVRAAVEKQLGLSDDYFKSEQWKDRSKDIIHDTATAPSDNEEEEKPPTKTRARPKLKSTAESPKAQPKPVSSKKRASSDHDVPRRKSRRVESEDDVGPRPKSPPQKKSNQLESEKEYDFETKGQAATKLGEKGVESSLSDLSDIETPSGEHSKHPSPTRKSNRIELESDLSEVEDAMPKRKRQKRTSSEAKKKDTASKPRKSKRESPEQADPDAEEVKRLQGWLAKCGIRKVWGKELKQYETSKAKVKHLKEMLSDVGMTGRYSKEKAAQIREARELQADLEAVQEGNKIWGKSDSEEPARNRKRSQSETAEDGSEPEPATRRRKLARGLQGLEDLMGSDSD